MRQAAGTSQPSPSKQLTLVARPAFPRRYGILPPFVRLTSGALPGEQSIDMRHAAS